MNNQTATDPLLTVPEALTATQGRLIHGDLHQVISGISTDSRTLKPGEMFVALQGERFDGHAFLDQALRREACGAVIEIGKHRIPETPEEEQFRRGKVIIGVSDTLSALQGLARFHRSRFRIPVVAITGSNGKTTTKEMAAAILSRDREVLKNEGNLNNHIGVPLALLRLNSRHRVAVLEMGIRRAGETRILAQVAQPQVGLITNIGPTHLETLGNIQGVAQAKSELLETLPSEKGIAILNQDDSFFDFLRAKTPCRPVSFGLRSKAQVAAVDLSMTGSSATAFRLVIQPEAVGLALDMAPDRKPSLPERVTEIEIRLPLLGTHNVLNAVAASAVAVVFGCELSQIKQALEAFQPVAMRSQLIRWHGTMIFNDAYNANPASMQAALEVLARWETTGQRIAVLGDMLELGAADRQAHWEVGERMARIPGGRLIAVGPRARLIAEQALSRGMGKERVSLCENPDEAARILKQQIKPGDVILVKGSRRMHLEEVLVNLGVLHQGH